MKNQELSIGTIVKLEEARGFRAKPGALAIVVDGETTYPHLYNQLKTRLKNNMADFKEFIWIEWIKTSPLWEGQDDGAALSYRFKKLNVKAFT